MTLVNVLVNVLDGRHTCAHLDVDVAAVLCEERGAVRDDVDVVRVVAPSTIQWVAFRVRDSRVGKMVREPLLAAPCGARLATALRRTLVDHILRHDVVQARVLLAVWDLGPSDAVNVFHRANLVLVVQNDQDVGVCGKPRFWNSTTRTYATTKPSSPLSRMSFSISASF